jgi:hypothetical protein
VKDNDSDPGHSSEKSGVAIKELLKGSLFLACLTFLFAWQSETDLPSTPIQDSITERYTVHTEEMITAVCVTEAVESSVLQSNQSALNSNGPWLLSKLLGGQIYALNTNGTGFTRLIDGGAKLISTGPHG